MAANKRKNLPGVGSIFQPSYRDRHGELKRSTKWSIRLTDGTQRATGLTDQPAAFGELIKLAAQQVSGSIVSVRGTVGELLDLALEDAKIKR